MAGVVLRPSTSGSTPGPRELQLKTIALDPSKGRDARRGDYSAFVLLGVDQQGLMYVEADLARRPTPQMVADGVALVRRFRPHAFGVEANQFQELLAGEFDAEFRRQGLSSMSAVADRQPRQQAGADPPAGAAPVAAAGCASRRDSPGTRLLVEQLRQFPVGDHDDGPDAPEMALRLASEMLARTAAGRRPGRSAAGGLRRNE